MKDKIKIIWIDIDKIKRYENNPRIHTEEQIEKLKKSIQQFGFLVPIVIDKNYQIVAGEGRYIASKELGLKEIPCIIADNLSEEQIKAFRIADNRIQELSMWDYEKLLLELKDLPVIDLSAFSEAEVLQLERQLLNHFDIEFDVGNEFVEEKDKKEKKEEKKYTGITIEVEKDKKELIKIMLDELADRLQIPKEYKQKTRWGYAILKLLSEKRN
ncbi:MAG: ParB/Srx family N-terminal domain-containing protein [candidate division WOR-3 bacterium]